MDLEPIFGRLREGFLLAAGDSALGLYALPDEEAFLGVTRDRVTGPTEVTLRSWHRDLDAPGLQGSYAPAPDLRSPMSLGRSWLRLSPGSGELLVAATDNTAYRRWQMLHDSTTLAGPSPDVLIHDIDVHGLRAEALGLARFRAEEIEEHPELLTDPEQVIALVSDLCSVLHTAVVGTVLTGPPAVTWALPEVPEREREVLWTVLGDRSPDPVRARSFAWELHRLVGAAALRLRET